MNEWIKAGARAKKGGKPFISILQSSQISTFEPVYDPFFYLRLKWCLQFKLPDVFMG